MEKATQNGRARRIKERIFRVIQIGNKEDVISRLFDIFIAAVILLNILAMTLETFDEMRFAYPLLRGVEIITVLIFCIEYALRIWTADLLYPNLSRPRAIGKFLLSFDGVIDLLTILPFFFLSGFVVFRMLRVVRIFHLFRINAQYDSFNVITRVLSEKKDQIVSSVFILLILMFAAEHEAQPEAFANAFSGVWWSVSALLTVGYGDIYPITVMGKIMAIVTAFLGVGVVAIPTGIISAGFVEQYTRIQHANVLGESSLPFVTVRITRRDWEGKRVSEAPLPQGLHLALILRGGEPIVPRSDTVFMTNDSAVLAAESSPEAIGMRLKEIIVKKGHPFAGRAICDLDISRLTTILTIRRRGRILIPDGSTILLENDRLTVYTRHTEPPDALDPDL